MFLNKPKTTAEVLSVFNKAITDLETVANTQVGEAAKLKVIADAAIAARLAALEESNKAVAIKAKLEALLA